MEFHNVQEYTIHIPKNGTVESKRVCVYVCVCITRIHIKYMYMCIKYMYINLHIYIYFDGYYKSILHRSYTI